MKYTIEAMPQVIQLTPPGRGAVASLRIEGPGALEIVQSRLRRRDGKQAALAADELFVGRFGSDDGETVVVRCCENGAVELHCHGGRAAVEMIEGVLAAAGCERAAWRDWAAGQFDDGIAAAAFSALAQARTQRTAGVLLDQFDGALRREVVEIQQAIGRGDRTEAKRLADAVLARADFGRHLTEPWRVVLAGGANVGKSSLINALAGYDRAIVHPTPGTTRDAVTVETVVDGWPVEFCDTAGMRGGARGVELAGIELACERLAAADLVVLVFDASRQWSEEDQALVERWPGALVVHNKCDLPVAKDNRPGGLMTSALVSDQSLFYAWQKRIVCRNTTLAKPVAHNFRLGRVPGDGIAELLDAIGRRLVADPPPAGGGVPFMPWQVEMIAYLASSID